MTNVISMVLFGDNSRYWRCIPAALLAARELYAGFEIWLYVSVDVLHNPKFPLLTGLARLCPDFKIILVTGVYTNTEPTLWRMKPLWEPGVDSFFCRDIDSVPCSEELRAMRVFLHHPNAAIHSIRSYKLHTILLMAGLCGFKPNQLGFITSQVRSFKSYMDYYRQLLTRMTPGEFGCDQTVLTNFFSPVIRMVLDSPLGNARPMSSLVRSVPDDVYKQTSLDDLNQDILRICDGVTATPWNEDKGFAGRPQGDFRTQLQAMLEINCPTSAVFKQLLEEHPQIAAYYQPEPCPSIPA